MEEAFLRFPHITEQIFEKVTNASLTKCRLVSDSWQTMIDTQKEIWIRKIKIHIDCSQVTVKKILRIKNTGRLIALANQIQQLYTKEDFPLHSAAKNGYLEIWHLIVENVQEKNLRNHNGETPLHYAAQNGHLEICRLIIEKIQEKNPKHQSGWTPLHSAAENGHLEICQLMNL